MKRKKVVSLIVLIITILMLTSYSFADFGDFERYDSYSPSDWESSSSDHSWKSDSYTDNGGSSYLRQGSNTRNAENTTNTFGTVFGFLLGTHGGRFFSLAVIILAIIIIKRANKTKEMYENGYRPYETNTNVVGNQHMNTIKDIDPNFSEEKFTEWAKDLFIKIQYAWSDRNLEPIRPFVSTEFFEQYSMQVKRYIDTDRINVLDRIAVNYATIYQFKQEGDRDILEVTIKSTMKDYIINATTEEVLEGNKEQSKVNLYRLTFERKTGVLTAEGSERTKTIKCPSCGAHIEITSAGKCPYCRTVIKIDSNTWTLSGIKRLSN